LIEEIGVLDVIANCRATLGLPGKEDGLDDRLLAGLLRRCAGMLCPCSRTTLRSALAESLSYLDDDPDTLSDRIDNLVDKLIVGGDLLELADVAIDDPNVRSTWVFAAPPSFVQRPSGAIFLIGIVPDQDTFLSFDLSARVVHDGCTRSITPEAGEDLAAVLLAQGLQHLPERVWLKSPKAERAETHLTYFENLLATQPPCGAINGLEILDPSKPVTYYRRRWVNPMAQTGAFIGRRPQEFGAPLWCFVDLAQGLAQRLIDLPRSGFHWRGCDAAWRLQMAIDCCSGQPQRYQRRDDEVTVRFDFFSPLPEWSQRRLMILGTQCPREQSLFAYEIPSCEADNEERFLRDNLWMVRSEDSKAGE